jgi:hypothetical protein
MLYITPSQTNAQNSLLRTFVIFVAIVLSASAMIGLRTIFTNAQTVPAITYSPARLSINSYVESQQAYQLPTIASTATISSPTLTGTTPSASSVVTAKTSSNSSKSNSQPPSNESSDSSSPSLQKTVCKVTLGLVCI